MVVTEGLGRGRVFGVAVEIRRSGKTLEMALLLVDDRDGRVVAEGETEEDARRVLEAWATDEGSVPDSLCLVELRSQHHTPIGVIEVSPLLHGLDRH
jgi:hypothetical protein